MQNGFQIYDIDTASAAARPILEQVVRHYQFIPNALGAMVESPEAVRAYLMLDELASENTLSEMECHVVFLAISREYNCSYCVAAHTAFAQMAKLNGEDIQALRNGQTLNNPRLNALQDFVTSLVRSDGHVQEQDVEAFLAQGYTRRNILEIITMIANKQIAIFANRVMGTDLDEALAAAKWSQAS